jgi:hypothetical protein
MDNEFLVEPEPGRYYVRHEEGIVTHFLPEDDIVRGWHPIATAPTSIALRLQRAASLYLYRQEQKVGHEPLTPNDYQTALNVQVACNLSGVVFSFARVMQRICNTNGGTDARNHHPIAVLFAEQIHALTGYSQGYAEAYAACEENAKVKED